MTIVDLRVTIYQCAVELPSGPGVRLSDDLQVKNDDPRLRM